MKSLFFLGLYLVSTMVFASATIPSDIRACLDVEDTSRPFKVCTVSMPGDYFALEVTTEKSHVAISDRGEVFSNVDMDRLHENLKQLHLKGFREKTFVYMSDTLTAQMDKAANSKPETLEKVKGQFAKYLSQLKSSEL